jgi:glutaminyl-peptide cyclotransferase
MARVAWVLAALLLASLSQPASSAPSPSSSASPGSSPAASAAASAAPVTILTFDKVSVRPHDTTAWTEGLVLDSAGRLFESTGRVGQSSVREVDPLTGVVLREAALPGNEYAEGLALVDERLIQLTWKDGVALEWDRDTFAPLGSFAYAGEGWGLCFDGTRLVMSDGTGTLTFRDPASFAAQGTVGVTFHGQPLARLNELECVDGAVWANVWETDAIVRIEPTTGAVTDVLDARGIIVPNPADSDRGAVLNGIAHDEGAGTFLLTGKLWPEMIEVRVRRS